MRHLKSGRKLGRTTAHRRALLRNMVTSLLEHERIKTTDAKAKELRRVAERMITLGKRGDLHARRQALAYIKSKDVVAKLFSELAERFQDRQGGYTRIVKIGFRAGDAARMSIIELVKDEAKPKAKKRARKKAAAKKAKKEEPKAAKKKEPEAAEEVKEEPEEVEAKAEGEEAAGEAEAETVVADDAEADSGAEEPGDEPEEEKAEEPKE